LDASTFAGGDVTVTLESDLLSTSPARSVIVDEVSLGGAAPGARQVFLPLCMDTYRGWQNRVLLPLMLRLF
jgi:hypothetical protein